MSDHLTMPYLPAQQEGEETTTTACYRAASEAAARAAFAAAVNRLLHVNRWKAFCGRLSAAFQLVDGQGLAVEEAAQEGLYIRIDIPGPGSAEGDGYDWVRIEKVERIVLNEQQELAYLRARPAPHPLHKEGAVAHFLQAQATSNFFITRDQLDITATVYGRNEVPNTHTGHIADNVRNAVIGASGAIGVSKLQWKAWVEGVLDKAD